MVHQTQQLNDLLFQLSLYGKHLKKLADQASDVRKKGYATDNVPDKPAIWRMTELANAIFELAHPPGGERAR